MNIEQAKQIYTNPKGHTEEELDECIEALNAAAQPVELNDAQYMALLDAQCRLAASRLAAKGSRAVSRLMTQLRQ